MRTVFLAGAVIGALLATPALAQSVSIGPPAAHAGWYGGHWGYGHSYGYGPGGYAHGSAAGPLVRVGYPWGPTYQTQSGYAAYIVSPVRHPYVGPPRTGLWWWQ
jgi:hypothetical protein